MIVELFVHVFFVLFIGFLFHTLFCGRFILNKSIFEIITESVYKSKRKWVRNFEFTNSQFLVNFLLVMCTHFFFDIIKRFSKGRNICLKNVPFWKELIDTAKCCLEREKLQFHVINKFKYETESFSDEISIDAYFDVVVFFDQWAKFQMCEHRNNIV